MTTGRSPHDDKFTDWVAITEMLTAWGRHRDAEGWDQLRGLFTAKATVELTWIHTTAAEFVAAARRHSTGPLRSKHVIANPSVTVVGNRAVGETNAVLVNDHLDLALGAVTHIRYLDRFERRDDSWAIAHRASIYDSSGFTFPYGQCDVDQAIVRRFPREYAALAYLLHISGYEPSDRSPVRGGTREQEIKDSNTTWLHRID